MYAVGLCIGAIHSHVITCMHETWGCNSRWCWIRVGAMHTVCFILLLLSAADPCPLILTRTHAAEVPSTTWLCMLHVQPYTSGSKQVPGQDNLQRRLYVVVQLVAILNMEAHQKHGGDHVFSHRQVVPVAIVDVIHGGGDVK